MGNSQSDQCAKIKELINLSDPKFFEHVDVTTIQKLIECGNYLQDLCALYGSGELLIFNPNSIKYLPGTTDINPLKIRETQVYNLVYLTLLYEILNGNKDKISLYNLFLRDAEDVLGKDRFASPISVHAPFNSTLANVSELLKHALKYASNFYSNILEQPQGLSDAKSISARPSMGVFSVLHAEVFTYARPIYLKDAAGDVNITDIIMGHLNIYKKNAKHEVDIMPSIKYIPTKEGKITLGGAAYKYGRACNALLYVASFINSTDINVDPAIPYDESKDNSIYDKSDNGTDKDKLSIPELNILWDQQKILDALDTNINVNVMSVKSNKDSPDFYYYTIIKIITSIVCSGDDRTPIARRATIGGNAISDNAIGGHLVVAIVIILAVYIASNIDLYFVLGVVGLSVGVYMMAMPIIAHSEN